MSKPQLFTTHCTVQPQWIDYNGHMNMGYYAVAFDMVATDAFFDYLGIGLEQKEKENTSTFTLGTNIDYLGEVLEGDRLQITTQLMDWDHKRLHFFHVMHHQDKGYVAATNECLNMYIDMTTRRATAFNQTQQERLAQELALGQAHDIPQGFGRKLGIRRPV